MGDVMLCDREGDIHPVKNVMLLSILIKITSQLFNSANVNFQQLYVFAMNKKASPLSTNPTEKCRVLFPYFPIFESRSKYHAMKTYGERKVNTHALLTSVPDAV
jgi:hypothetical protein